jgi:glycosyltransferase involved in cell wall biosynthesis
MRKKILLLSDDLRMTSGIATISKEFVMGTLNKYDWVQLGAANNHPDIGKIFDFSQDAINASGDPNAVFKVIPNNGYGEINQLRKLIKEETPDAILHFTDPHYWQWLYDNEAEIRQKIPILFYHIWDNLPDPLYNKDYYESCDWISCISRQTYGIVNRVGKRKDHVTQVPLEDWQISYVPHGINPDIFKPLTEISADIYNSLFGLKNYEFVLFYNNRNIRRKQPADVIEAFKIFCDKLPKEKSDKCLLLMHTNPIDDNGTDLNACKEVICPDYDVLFSPQRIPQDILNQVYNLVDCTINIANNEGFGLTTAESLMSGTPIITNVTGGLQDQCGLYTSGREFSHKDYINLGTLHNKKEWDFLEHGEWCVPIWPIVHSINGSPLTPYIYDDRVNNDDVADAIMTVYNWSKQERKRRGLKGREWMMKNLSSKIMCEKMSEGIDTAINNFKPKKKYNLYKIV